MAYGGHLYLVCTVCDVTIWCNIHVSKPTFWRSLLIQYAYSSTRAPLISCVIALNINNQHSNLGYRRKIHFNSTTQQFITAKISDYALKQGSKTHSSIRQSNLQLQTQAALMPHRIRAVEHRCAAALTGAHPDLQDRILLNYARIENAHKSTQENLFFVMYGSPANF